MSEQSFRQEQKQSQVFSPQLRQSLKILQVPAIELRDIILEELQSNPVLEELPANVLSIEQPTESKKDASEQEFQDNHETIQELDTDWQDPYEFEQRTRSYSSEDISKRQHFIDSVTQEVSLQEHIMDQAKLSECSQQELDALEYLLGSLDDRGFLTENIKAMAKDSKIPQAVLQQSLQMLKELEPVGIGSTDVQDCLLTQLKVQGREGSIASEIIRDHYDLLLKRKVPDLAKKLNLQIEDIREALEEIASLDPAPGRRFKEDSNRIVTADARAEKIGNSWIVTLNNVYIPQLCINKAYKDLIAKGQLTSKERDYIKDKIHSAKWIITAIEQRQKTLESITNAILQFQRDFFEKGVSKLHPLTMNAVGEFLSLHETTVGRAIANKYLQTPRGLFPYRYFFTSGYESQEEGGRGISNTSIKETIAHLIHSEPKNKPYSDQKIVEMLAEKNIHIARRTVAKYREELGILSTSLRRQY